MKKVLLSGSFKKMFLAFAILASYVGNAMAQIKVSEPDVNGVVTITTTDANQIGAKGQWEAYVWASDVTESQKTTIKEAKGVKLAGIISSVDVKSLVEACKNSRNHVYWSTLDMSKSLFVDELKVDASQWNVNSHCFLPQGWYAIHATSFAFPKLKNGTAIPSYFGSAFEDLRALTIPEGYTDIKEGAFAKNTFKFANLTFPASIKNIEKAAFYGNVRDVYFLGKKAPKVDKEAFGSETYYGNSGFVDPAEGIYTATRDNYYNQGKSIAVLHLRNDLTAAERAAFTDVTRKYHVFTREQDDIESNDPDAEVWGDNGYCYVMAGDKKFESWTNESHSNYVKASSHYDTNLGSQYVWPCQDQMVYAYENAGKNLLWDGKTSIGDGIRNAGDASYVGDGSEYAGLHEFVLVSYDVTGTKTPHEWGFDNIGEANWYTICIPINMTVKQVRETFGEETEVCKFSKVTRNSDVKVRLEFKDEQCYGKTDLNAIAIAANEAYMIRPGNYQNARTKFVLDGYEVDEKVAPIGTTIAVKDEGMTAHTPAGGHKYTFIGNYQNGEDGELLHMPQYSYFLGVDDNNPDIHKLFFQTADYGTWRPYTCVVLVDNGDGTGEDDYTTFFEKNEAYNNKAKGCNSFFGSDPSTTGIDDIEIVAGKNGEKVNLAVYDINGKLVNKNGNTEGLSKGIYIQNGKKFIIK